MTNSSAPDPLPPQPGFWSDLFAYARKSKKWWLVPLILVLVVVGFLIAGASGALPFVYTLF
jgi:hydrogenase/urease accessory protein HupE